MIYGNAWSAVRVLERLVAAFRVMRETGVYSPAKNVLQASVFGHPIDGLELVMATTHYLGRDSPARVELLTFARALAIRSVSRECRERGISRATWYRHVGTTASQVADRLNLDRGDFMQNSSF